MSTKPENSDAQQKQAPNDTPPEAALANTISIEDVIKVDLRVGTIVTSEEVPGSEKLLKSQVNFGDLGMRQIFSGVRPSITAQDLIGNQAIFVVNLKPRKIMGQESQGMMLITKDAENKLVMVKPVAMVPNGTKLS